MSETTAGQVTANAAEVYEEFFVPALFQPWATRVAEAAELRAGEHVLDVACGTGVLTRAAAERVAPSGSVIGLDRNPAMLAVARSKSPGIEWREGRAEALPFDDETFDAVVSQFGLMFFEDRPGALREMMRVLRRGGRLTVAVWDSLANTAGYPELTNLLQRLFGSEAADALRAPFTLGDESLLRELFAGAGISDVQLTRQDGTARYPSLESWLHTEIKGWVLADVLSDEQFGRLLSEAQALFRPFMTAGGAIELGAPAYIATASKGG